jgi:hypothetical protein
MHQIDAWSARCAPGRDVACELAIPTVTDLAYSASKEASTDVVIMAVFPGAGLSAGRRDANTLPIRVGIDFPNVARVALTVLLREALNPVDDGQGGDWQDCKSDQKCLQSRHCERC